MEPQQIFLASLAVALAVYLFWTGGVARLEESGRESLSLVSQVWPNFVLGMVLAGLITVAIPNELLGRYLGEDSGLRGVLLATLVGAVTPGGPYLQFPILAGLHRSGVAAGPLAAYLTSWSVIAVHRTVIWEMPFLGVPFSFSRLILSLFMPVLVGMALPQVLRLLK